MAVTSLRPDATFHQMASRPDANVWVTASAGTGKTTALVERILRLLLAGAAPSAILAITFTKTAAAEMQGRVLDELARWARMDDVALDKALEKLGEPRTPERRSAARGLFLHVLDAPEGLQIRTIHATAQSLLSAFPLEAGLPPRADPLDERGAARLRDQALRDVLEAAAGPGGTALGADIGRIAVEAGEAMVAKLLPALARAGPAYAEIGGPRAVEGWLRALVGLPPEGDLPALLEACVSPPLFDDAWVRGWIAGFEALGTEAKQREADAARAWLALKPLARVERIAGLFAMVRTTGLAPRKLDREIAKVPALAEPVRQLLEATGRIIETQLALAFVAHAGAWLRLGMAVADRYERLKRGAAAVDFDDMVGLAANLLEADGMANFVAARLDRRIAHALVDEAQDTNRGQWRLIDGLTADFDSGAGAHEGSIRTRFVVGDFKQAIFRFQGTDPRIFLDVRDAWRKATAAAGNRLADVPLDTNFRSAPLILGLVDRVLAELGPEAIGLPPGEALPTHRAEHTGLAARVLLLPPHEVAADAEAAEEPEPDDEPGGPGDPLFAERIAGVVAALVSDGSPDRPVISPKGGPPRPAGPGDVLILVQARGDLMPALVRALHARALPVAGVDRTRLSKPLAVRDCLSLIRFVLQPADDLALAEVLTSPLGGLDHEGLRKARQPGRTLWESIADRGDLAVVAFLRDALRRADFAGPHGFLQAMLAAGGRARFRARLGPEADDGLDLLLAEALAFEADRPATLQGFLAHVAASDGELARDPDSSPGLVRIMTVHGAKGLEAPIVVLADALRQTKPQPRSVLWRSPDGLLALPLIFGSGARKPLAIAALAAAAEAEERAEHNRLLYVAMTRARQLLVVAGQVSPRVAATRAKADGDESRLETWHDRIRRAMAAMGATEVDAGSLGRHLRLAAGDWPAPAPAEMPAVPPPVPSWALAAPPPEPAPARPFTPSEPAADEAPLAPVGSGLATAAARGRLLHRLFEKLPAVPEPARESTARRVIAAAGHDHEADSILAALFQTMAHPDLAPLFAPQALAEAPIAGVVDGIVISGTVDRLLVTDSAVLVADFKTGLFVPDRSEAAHPSHLKQMAAYRAVLRAAFPGRAVTAALVYTAAPKILFLPDKLLDAHAPVAAAPAGAISSLQGDMPWQP